MWRWGKFCALFVELGYFLMTHVVFGITGGGNCGDGVKSGVLYWKQVVIELIKDN